MAVDKYHVIANNLVYRKALNAFAKLFNEASQKEKHKYLFPILNSGITRSHARELGFKTTSYMWKNCRRTHKRNKGFVIIFPF